MDELKRLGLTGKEIAVYETLLKLGRCNANKISEYSKVPPTAIYLNLKLLINKGLVQKIDGEMSMFEVIEPSIAIKTLTEKRINELKNTTEEIIPRLNSLSSEINEEKKEIAFLSHGEEASYNITKEMINNAKKSLYMIGWRFKTITHLHDFLRDFNSLVKRKIDVRIIVTDKDPKHKKLIKEYISSGVKIKYFPLENFSVTVRDAKECKITFKDPELPSKINIRINDEDLAKYHNNYFLDLWKRAENWKDKQSRNIMLTL